MQTSLLQCRSWYLSDIHPYVYVYRQWTFAVPLHILAEMLAKQNWSAFVCCLFQTHWSAVSHSLSLSLCLSISNCLSLFLSRSNPQWGQLAQLEHSHLMGHSQCARFQAFYTFQRFLPLFICNLRQITRTTCTVLPLPSTSLSYTRPLRLLTGLWSAQIAPGSSECCLFQECFMRGNIERDRGQYREESLEVKGAMIPL